MQGGPEKEDQDNERDGQTTSSRGAGETSQRDWSSKTLRGEEEEGRVRAAIKGPAKKKCLLGPSGAPSPCRLNSQAARGFLPFRMGPPPACLGKVSTPTVAESRQFFPVAPHSNPSR